MEKPRKIYRCPNNHVIGYVLRRRLYILRQALPAEQVNGPFSIAGEAVGDYVAYCSICGASRTWHFYKSGDPCPPVVDQGRSSVEPAATM